MLRKHRYLPYLLIVLLIVVAVAGYQLVSNINTAYHNYINSQDRIYDFADSVIIDCQYGALFEERDNDIVAFVCGGEDYYLEKMNPEIYEDFIYLAVNPAEDNYSLTIVKLYLENNEWAMVEIWATDLTSEDLCTYKKMGDCSSHILLWTRYEIKLYDIEYVVID